jgi:hypothetical protein
LSRRGKRSILHVVAIHGSTRSGAMCENKTELQFGSKQCTILSFSGLHKGYKCPAISIGRAYISWNRTFDEFVFSFSQDRPNSGDQLHALNSFFYHLLWPSILVHENELLHDHMYVSAIFSLENNMHETICCLKYGWRSRCWMEVYKTFVSSADGCFWVQSQLR